MNKYFVSSLFLGVATVASLLGVPSYRDDYTRSVDITNQIPQIAKNDGFEKVHDAAQYKGADWSNAVGIAHRISLAKAKKIANEDPCITFFFYMKGPRMVLETEEGTYRVFYHGDAIFFTGSPWWGSATGLSDGYMKTN